MGRGEGIETELRAACRRAQEVRYRKEASERWVCATYGVCACVCVDVCCVSVWECARVRARVCASVCSRGRSASGVCLCVVCERWFAQVKLKEGELALLGRVCVCVGLGRITDAMCTLYYI